MFLDDIDNFEKIIVRKRSKLFVEFIRENKSEEIPRSYSQWVNSDESKFKLAYLSLFLLILSFLIFFDCFWINKIAILYSYSI